jgi:hypothetical protein
MLGGRGAANGSLYTLGAWPALTALRNKTPSEACARFLKREIGRKEVKEKIKERVEVERRERKKKRKK